MKRAMVSCRSAKKNEAFNHMEISRKYKKLEITNMYRSMNKEAWLKPVMSIRFYFVILAVYSSSVDYFVSRVMLPYKFL